MSMRENRNILVLKSDFLRESSKVVWQRTRNKERRTDIHESGQKELHLSSPLISSSSMLSECLLKIQIKNTIRDDSIQSEKGSTDHEKGLRNLVREIRKSMVYSETSLLVEDWLLKSLQFASNFFFFFYLWRSQQKLAGSYNFTYQR